jgi:hypothetical protein
MQNRVADRGERWHAALFDALVFQRELYSGPRPHALCKVREFLRYFYVRFLGP